MCKQTADLRLGPSELKKTCVQVIGKAMYEQMLLEHQFTRAFLNKVLEKFGDAEDLVTNLDSAYQGRIS